MRSVSVLRLGHRAARDIRATSHCALVARALGASRFILTGERDESVLKTAKGVAEKWGGKFDAEYCATPQKFAKEFDGVKVHLTMYGLKVQDEIESIRKENGQSISKF